MQPASSYSYSFMPTKFYLTARRERTRRKEKGKLRRRRRKKSEQVYDTIAGWQQELAAAAKAVYPIRVERQRTSQLWLAGWLAGWLASLRLVLLWDTLLSPLTQRYYFYYYMTVSSYSPVHILLEEIRGLESNQQSCCYCYDCG